MCSKIRRIPLAAHVEATLAWVFCVTLAWAFLVKARARWSRRCLGRSLVSAGCELQYSANTHSGGGPLSHTGVQRRGCRLLLRHRRWRPANSFGLGASGQLGHGATGGQQTPLVIEALQGVHVFAVAAGQTHSLALSVVGEGRQGQLGHGDAARQHAPQLVAALQGGARLCGGGGGKPLTGAERGW